MIQLTLELIDMQAARVVSKENPLVGQIEHQRSNEQVQNWLLVKSLIHGLEQKTRRNC